MNKSTFHKLAVKHGINVDYEPGNAFTAARLTLESPKGKVFNTSGCHIDCSIQCLTESGKSMVWPDAYRELESIVEHGFDDCPDGFDCDVCNEGLTAC